MSTKGIFVISLDFELYFGMFDKVTLAQYGENIAGVHTALPHLLSIFKKREIHATWATVGMLMAKDEQELRSRLPTPAQQPRYKDMRVSAYEYLRTHSPLENQYHFAPNLVRQIVNTPNQELGSHTFSHYYVQDGAENGEAIFRADCDTFAEACARTGVSTTSIVFPRNQITSDALMVCAQKGFTAYRGTPEHFLYTGKAESKQTNPFLRALRLLDTYINLTGYHTHPSNGTNAQESLMAINRHNDHTTSGATTVNIPVTRHAHEEVDALTKNSTIYRTIPTHEVDTKLVNVPGSWFLRPYNHTLRFLEWLKIRRIKKAMTYAAKHGEMYHLWWHPHNFGKNQEQNFKNLLEILNHFAYLKKEYCMESMNMVEVSKRT